MSNSATPSSSSSITQPSTPSPSPVCTDLHTLYCLDVLSAHFEGREPIEPPFENPDEALTKRSICDLEYDFAPPTFPETGVARMYRELLAYALSEGVEGVCPRQVGFCLGATRSIDAEAIVLTVPWKTIDSRPSKPPNSPPSHASEPDFPSYPSWPKSFRDVPYPDLPSVSLLTPFTPISDPLAWTPSTHGIHLTFPHPTEPHRTLSATYLPEVCPEQGWSREETVLSAIQKAGWAGRVEVGDAVWRSLRVKVYGSVKAGTGYRAYIGWRKGGEGT